MRLPRLWFVVLALSLGSASSSLFAQSKAPRNDGEKPAAKAATEEEVEQLRREVRELRAVIQKMLEVSGQDAVHLRSFQVAGRTRPGGVTGQPAGSGRLPPTRVSVVRRLRRSG